MHKSWAKRLKRVMESENILNCQTTKGFHPLSKHNQIQQCRLVGYYYIIQKVLSLYI